MGALIREAIGGLLFMAFLKITTPEQFNQFVSEVEGKRMPVKTDG